MSYSQLLYHIVFRTHSSTPAITIAHEDMLYRYVWGIVKGKDGILYRIGGMPDHIHMLVQLPPTVAVADFVRDVKVASNIFLKEHPVEFPHFRGWGTSYCALTYSRQEKDMIVNYIMSQKEHHKRVSFQDELAALLQEQGIAYDKEYFLRK